MATYNGRRRLNGRNRRFLHHGSIRISRKSPRKYESPNRPKGGHFERKRTGKKMVRIGSDSLKGSVHGSITSQILPQGQFRLHKTLPVPENALGARGGTRAQFNTLTAANANPTTLPFLVRTPLLGVQGDTCALDAMEAQFTHFAAQHAALHSPTAFHPLEIRKGGSDGSMGAAMATTPSESEKHSEKSDTFSRKIFVGGLPFDATDVDVARTFAPFGPLVVDWPSSAARAPAVPNLQRHGVLTRRKSGYAFVVFEDERSVGLLVNTCYREGDKCYVLMSTPTMRNKPVQIRAWRLSDGAFYGTPDVQTLVNYRWTVFIGGIPRPTKSRELANLLGEKFGHVAYVNIDVDPELKYPKGAARVTFSDCKSFMAALKTRFFEIPNAEGDFAKRVEIKPYVVCEQLCDECDGSECEGHYAQYFCSDLACLQYFCEPCWIAHHLTNDAFSFRALHKPIVLFPEHPKEVSCVVQKGDVAEPMACYPMEKETDQMALHF